MVEPLPCSWPDAKARPPAPHLASVPATSKSFGVTIRRRATTGGCSIARPRASTWSAR